LTLPRTSQIEQNPKVPRSRASEQKNQMWIQGPDRPASTNVPTVSYGIKLG